LKVHEFARRRFPDGSGFEVCSRLREGEPGRAWDRDVPVIMVSARGDPVDRVRGFSRGCDDYVVKPFVYEELVARAVPPPSAREGSRVSLWGFRESLAPFRFQRGTPRPLTDACAGRAERLA
jgi:hypothetical protein